MACPGGRGRLAPRTREFAPHFRESRTEAAWFETRGANAKGTSQLGGILSFHLAEPQAGACFWEAITRHATILTCPTAWRAPAHVELAHDLSKTFNVAPISWLSSLTETCSGSCSDFLSDSDQVAGATARRREGTRDQSFRINLGRISRARMLAWHRRAGLTPGGRNRPSRISRTNLKQLGCPRRMRIVVQYGDPPAKG